MGKRIKPYGLTFAVLMLNPNETPSRNIINSAGRLGGVKNMRRYLKMFAAVCIAHLLVTVLVFILLMFCGGDKDGYSMLRQVFFYLLWVLTLVSG